MWITCIACAARECLDAGVDSTKIAVDRSICTVRLENSEHSVNTVHRVLATPVPSCTRRDGGGAAERRQAWAEDGSQRMRKSRSREPVLRSLHRSRRRHAS